MTEAVHDFVVMPADAPDPAWLKPGAPSAAQQAFGDKRLRTRSLVLIPSVIFAAAADRPYDRVAQEEFGLDGRLRLGAALAEMSRRIGLTNADVEVLDRASDARPAEPLGIA